MTDQLRQQIHALLNDKNIPVMGVASAARLNAKAPEGFRPMDHLPEAQSVLIFAKPLPVSVFTAPRQNKFHAFYTAAFHSYYQAMNETMNNLCLMLEDAGFSSLPIPSYSPIRFYKGEPRGMMSLKHAAAEAGIGTMGKNTLLIHPKLGNVTRLGGLLTTMPWPESDKPANLAKLCPESCDKCIQACPVKALSEKGINKNRCMVNCVEHSMLPPYFIWRILGWFTAHSRMLTRMMDLITVSFFDSYGISCFNCLRACPHFPGKKS